MKLRSNSKFIHLIATFAILMSALAPTISQAFASNDSNKSLATEICSAVGTKLIHVVAIDDQSSDHPLLAEHCPYCAIQATFLPSLNSDLNFALRQNNQLFPQLYYQSPKPLFSWLHLPSQAPPSIS